MAEQEHEKHKHEDTMAVQQWLQCWQSLPYACAMRVYSCGMACGIDDSRLAATHHVHLALSLLLSAVLPFLPSARPHDVTSLGRLQGRLAG